MFFLQPSTDDRKDFELNASGDDLIVFKSPVLTIVSIAYKDLNDSLDKIIEDLDLNLWCLKMIALKGNKTYYIKKFK